MSSSDTQVLAAATDGALARAIAAAPAGGASAAEDELYRRFAPRVRQLGRRRLRDEMAAQDLSQQVMLVVIERLRAGEVREPDQIGSFILGTSRMIVGGIRRTERRRQDLHLRFDLPAATVRHPDNMLLDMDRIEDCLAAVRERERSILVLTFYAEKASSEIADALGLSPGAVRVGRHRALAAMRECLDARRLA
jgi:RNA polymerase sigma-70 factor (ECF subfamily)